MKIKSSLRRTASLLAGAVIGLTGVAAMAAPASAHDAWVTGSATCGSDGKNVVTWTLTNDFGTDATVNDLKIPAGATKPVDANGHELTEGYVLPRRQNNANGQAVFTQVFDGGTEVQLSFTATWPTDNFTESSPNNTANVQLKQDCTPPAPVCEATATRFHHTFALVDGKWKAVVKLDDDSKLCNDEPVTLVSYFAPKASDKDGDNWPQYEYEHASDTITDQHRTATLDVAAPDCNTQVDLFFGAEKDIINPMTQNGARYGDRKLGSGSGLGGRSKGPQGWYNGGSKACTTPAVAPVSDCTGELTVNLTNNGKLGKYDVTFTVKFGGETKTVTVAAGKSEAVKVPAGAGDVTVSAPGLEEKTYSWSRPEDCPLPAVTIQNDCTNVTVVIDNPKDVTPVTAKVTYGDQTKTVTVKADSEEKATFKLTDVKFALVDFAGIKMEPLKVAVKDIKCGAVGTPSPSPSGGPSLPVTGAAAGSIAGIAALLVGGGVVAFFIARRRKVKFTA
ncbi:hypothetical protein ACWT_7195 [Actinoplanes sp. SE50]|uniref:hypothetical protein n=1 Tax=unclassified Actinoplanes TaxID=2626549 RepID=UPI00023EDE8F|nr:MULTISPECIES: hypothetical protein [unclassified Actinoplanes]AEV88205.1 hypothetical protein ACPL_7325 [Actinoplanes sp. SE50/110]ATO86610.1 hypothetical protein ACWT_7195 [Actinoplanes sp. SE50]SLM04027.1 uncharacterized protein ACSP50_7326 [Actinoplanes sp. SE50/110]